MATPTAVMPDAPELDEPRMRLSWPRLGLLVLLVAALAAGGVAGVRWWRASSSPASLAWGVPYVDVTLVPAYQFQDPAANPSGSVALGFVVADRAQPCRPSWGAAYGLDDAAQALELDRRITSLRDGGGDVVVSFGGQANTELAVACTDPVQLLDAYRSVVDRYRAVAIDLDVEGSSVADEASVLRRARALAALQAERKAAGHDLAVWLTLPVTPSGLTADAQRLVATTLAAGVTLRGVDVMTMDYGTGYTGRADMLALTEQALTATAGQVGQLWRARGVALNPAQRWALVGATPMIGQNDVDAEVFTLEDARGLLTFARSHGLGRMSFWSINRDRPCGRQFDGVVVHSSTCSDVVQEPLAFTKLLASLPGEGPGAGARKAITIPDQRAEVDDPGHSPYPVWRPEAQYPEAYKVVWHGEVYQATWYNQGSDPSATSDGTSPGPWSDVGPVVPTDTAPRPQVAVTGVGDVWRATVRYVKGDRVLLDGLPYQARWTTAGDVPPTAFPPSPDDPWKPLFTLPGEPPA